jgi:hypothetical protein
MEYFWICSVFIKITRSSFARSMTAIIALVLRLHPFASRLIARTDPLFLISGANSPILDA